MAKDSKSLVPQNYQPGSQPLRDRVKERYCRYRAQALPRIEAYRRARVFAFRGRNGISVSPDTASQMAYQYDRQDKIAHRIRYLSTVGLDEQILAKRNRIEERLWSIHESDIGDYFETTPNGNEKPKRLSDIPPELRKNIEKIAFDTKGNVIPQLYAKTVASKELRAMLAFGRSADANDVSRLSDADLVAQLSDTAKELGVEIDLNFRFAQQQEPSSSEVVSGEDVPQVIDNIEDDTTKR